MLELVKVFLDKEIVKYNKYTKVVWAICEY